MVTLTLFEIFHFNSMDYKTNDNDLKLRLTSMKKYFVPQSIDEITSIDYFIMEDDLTFLSQYQFNGDEGNEIYSSGLLPKLNFHLLQMPDEMQIEVLIFFTNMAKSNEFFSLLLIESGLFLNLSILWMKFRHTTSKLLLELSNSKLIAQRILLFLNEESFEDINTFTDEAKTSTIELLFALLDIDPYGMEEFFIKSIVQILKADHSLTDFISFKIIDASKDSKISIDLLKWYTSDEIQELWFHRHDDETPPTGEIIQFVINTLIANDNKEDDEVFGINVEEINSFIDCLKIEFDFLNLGLKNLLCYFMNQFDLFKIDNFIEFFGLCFEEILELSSGLDLCLNYTKFLCNMTGSIDFITAHEYYFSVIYELIILNNQSQLLPKLIPLGLFLHPIIADPETTNNNSMIFQMFSFSEDKEIDFDALFEDTCKMKEFIKELSQTHEQEVKAFTKALDELFGFKCD